MLDLAFNLPRNRPLQVLAIGAHSDDIEIGCAGTLMRWAAERPIAVNWVVLAASGPRAAEARRSAKLVLRQARSHEVHLGGFRDGFLPAQWAEVKQFYESLKRLPAPDVIFTHEPRDLHQDHRIACELTWNTFRDHVILEYEIPKYDGGLGAPSTYVPVSRRLVDRKCKQLARAFVSQRGKPWFTDETFRGLMRVRGIECNAADGFAEAFYARKIRL